MLPRVAAFQALIRVIDILLLRSNLLNTNFLRKYAINAIDHLRCKIARLSTKLEGCG